MRKSHRDSKVEERDIQIRQLYNSGIPRKEIFKRLKINKAIYRNAVALYLIKNRLDILKDMLNNIPVEKDRLYNLSPTEKRWIITELRKAKIDDSNIESKFYWKEGKLAYRDKWRVIKIKKWHKDKEMKRNGRV